MSKYESKVSREELRDLFIKYDVNNDSSIDENELTKLVTHIYQKNNNFEKLTTKNDLVIKKSVEKLMKLKDKNQDGKLQIDEFISYYKGQNICDQTEKILEKNRILVYSNRIGMLIRRMNLILANTGSYAFADIGESIKPLVKSIYVKLLYGISGVYVIVDTYLKTNSMKYQDQEKKFLYSLDTAMWHGLASIGLPALFINSIVRFSGKFFLLGFPTRLKILKFGPTIIGLSVIPFVIDPIDQFTDWILDNTVRKIYHDRLPCSPHHSHKH